MSGDLRLGPRALYPLKAAATFARSAAWSARPRRREAESGIRILFYHRVANARDELAVTPGRFARQMEYLAARGFRGVDVAEVGTLLDNGDGAGVIGLSFDDAYLDVAEHALPVLARHGFRATVYVPTGVIDGRARFTWYDEQPPVMSWETIVELDRTSPLRFEAHTVTHPNLLTLDDARARREIEGSKRELEDRLGREVTSFCYPGGVFGERERDLVAAANFRTAVSCEPGVNGAETDRLALFRRQIDARDTMLDFRAKVGGGHDTPPPGRALYRRLRYGASSRS